MEPAEIRDRAATGAVSLGLRSFAVRGLAFFGNLALARLLLPSEFGIMAFGFTIVTLGGIVIGAGLGAGFVRREENPEEEDLQSVLAFQLLASVAVAGVVAALGMPFGDAGLVAAIMAISLPIDAFRVPTYIVVERNVSWSVIARVEVVEALVYQAVAIGTVLLGAGVYGVAVAVCVKSLIGTTAMISLGPLGLTRPRLEMERIRNVLRFGLKFQATSVVLTLREQGVNIFTMGIAGSTALGYWGLSTRLLRLSSAPIFDSVGRVLFAAVARLLEAGEPARLSLERTLSVAFVISGVFMVPLASTAPALVPILFGNQWGDAVPVVIWAATGFFVAAPMVLAIQTYLWSIGEAGLVLRLTVFKALIMLITAAALLPSMGAVGVGIASFASALIVDLALSGWILSRRASLRIAPVVANAVAAALVAGAGGRLMVEIFTETAALGAALGAFTSVILYLGVLFVFSRESLLAFSRVVRRGLLGLRPVSISSS